MRILHALAAAFGWLTFGGVLIYSAAVRFIGEHTWPTTVGLYLPHGMLLVPIAFATVLLMLFGPRRLIIAEMIAATVVVVPLMGLHGGRAVAPSGAPRLRLFSYNVDDGRISIDEIVAQVRDAAPDIVLLQA